MSQDAEAGVVFEDASEGGLARDSAVEDRLESREQGTKFGDGAFRETEECKVWVVIGVLEFRRKKINFGEGLALLLSAEKDWVENGLKSLVYLVGEKVRCIVDLKVRREKVCNLIGDGLVPGEEVFNREDFELVEFETNGVRVGAGVSDGSEVVECSEDVDGKESSKVREVIETSGGVGKPNIATASGGGSREILQDGLEKCRDGKAKKEVSEIAVDGVVLNFFSEAGFVRVHVHVGEEQVTINDGEAVRDESHG